MKENKVGNKTQITQVKPTQAIYFFRHRGKSLPSMPSKLKFNHGHKGNTHENPLQIPAIPKFLVVAHLMNP